MIQQQIRKSGNSYVVTIPKSEMERLGLREGQMVALDLTPLEVKPMLRPEIAKILDRTTERAAPLMKYLKDK
jgi:antitoxin component of MazEF toxin-antitoxin module